jgi:hypothetical protein
MINVPMAAARQVATNTASFGTPASPRMLGLTKMMYAMVRNVVTPGENFGAGVGLVFTELEEALEHTGRWLCEGGFAAWPWPLVRTWTSLVS